MNDTVIKGTGNSRTLKSVPNLLTMYPTYQDFAQALINGELPIDLGALNSAGLQTSGTPYNKANVLPNTTCSNLGISTSSVPKDAFDRLRTLIQTAQSTANNAQNTADAAPKFERGSYVGTSTYGSTGYSSITFPFVPKYVAIAHNVRRSDGWVTSTGDSWILDTSVLTTAYKQGVGFYNETPGLSSVYGRKSPDGKTVYWYADSARQQLNEAIYEYHYFGIG